MKQTKRKILIPLLTAVGFGALAVGSTFALFTDKAEVNIQVGAGKIDISSSIKNIVTYSAVGDSEGTIQDENHFTYKHVAQGTEMVQGVKHYMFINHGYATFDDETNALTLKDIAPGDRIDFGFDVGNESTIDFKYRFTYRVENNNYALSDAFETSIKIGTADADQYTGLRNYRSAWQVCSPSTSLDGLAFSISFPMDSGNIYQVKTATIYIGFEAVQANAVTLDESLVEMADASINGMTFEDNTASRAELELEDDADLVITASNVAADVTVTVNVPAATEEVTSTDNVTLSVSEATVTTTAQSDISTLNFDISLKVNGEQQSSYSEPILVEIDIGIGYHIATVKHNGTTIENTGNPSTGFAYDPAEGVVRFYTQSFSPFTVEYYVNVVNVTTWDELKVAAADPYTTVLLKNDINVPLRTVRSGMAGSREVFEPDTCQVAAGVTIDGGNHTLILPSFYVDSATLNAVLTLNGATLKIMGDGATVKNLTIDSSRILNQKATIDVNHKNNLQLIDCTFFGDLDYIGAGQVLKNVDKDLTATRVHVYDAMAFIYESDGNVLDGKIKIEDSLINTYYYTINFGDSTVDSEVLIKNSELRGWTSYDGKAKITFDGVSFGKTYFSDNSAGAYNFLRAYANSTFQGCTFDDNFSTEIINFAVANFNSCKIHVLSSDTLVDLTAANYESDYSSMFTLINSGYAEIHDGAKIIINGTTVATLEVEPELAA